MEDSHASRTGSTAALSSRGVAEVYVVVDMKWLEWTAVNANDCGAQELRSTAYYAVLGEVHGPLVHDTELR